MQKDNTNSGILYKNTDKLYDLEVEKLQAGSEKMVPIDTSGESVDVELKEDKNSLLPNRKWRQTVKFKR